jgi:hypothetical protein
MTTLRANLSDFDSICKDDIKLMLKGYQVLELQFVEGEQVDAHLLLRVISTCDDTNMAVISVHHDREINVYYELAVIA